MDSRREPLHQPQPHQNCTPRQNLCPGPTYWCRILVWKSISSWHILVVIDAILLSEPQIIFQHMDLQEKLPHALSLPRALMLGFHRPCFQRHPGHPGLVVNHHLASFRAQLGVHQRPRLLTSEMEIAPSQNRSLQNSQQQLLTASRFHKGREMFSPPITKSPHRSSRAQPLPAWKPAERKQEASLARSQAVVQRGQGRFGAASSSFLIIIFGDELAKGAGEKEVKFRSDACRALTWESQRSPGRAVC